MTSGAAAAVPQTKAIAAIVNAWRVVAAPFLTLCHCCVEGKRGTIHCVNFLVSLLGGFVGGIRGATVGQFIAKARGRMTAEFSALPQNPYALHGFVRNRDLEGMPQLTVALYDERENCHG